MLIFVFNVSSIIALYNLVNVLVGNEEDDLLALHAGQLEHDLEVLAKVGVLVAFLDVQLEHVTIGDVGGQLHDRALAAAIHANEQHVPGRLTYHSTRSANVLDGLFEEDNALASVAAHARLHLIVGQNGDELAPVVQRLIDALVVLDEVAVEQKLPVLDSLLRLATNTTTTSTTTTTNTGTSARGDREACRVRLLGAFAQGARRLVAGGCGERVAARLLIDASGRLWIDLEVRAKRLDVHLEVVAERLVEVREEDLIVVGGDEAVVEDAYGLVGEQVHEVLFLVDHLRIGLHEAGDELVEIAQVENVVRLGGRGQHVDEDTIVDDDAGRDEREQARLDVHVELVVLEEAAQLHLVDVEERARRRRRHAQNAALTHEARRYRLSARVRRVAAEQKVAVHHLLVGRVLDIVKAGL